MMEHLIPIVNQLQDVCNAVAIPLPIDLPQIVVVGLQSSGKSSVIESIVKREFLPRGSGIVTRRPLVIRLFKINEQDSQFNESAPLRSSDWVKFAHSEKIFTNFDEVREEIQDETERLCGSNKGISAEPITLSVYSKNVVNLTLVDLPGITRNPVGDQPLDIEIQIRELVTNYITNPNSIILAVTAANTDFATSEAIQLARQVDPEGKRTLAVLTKLDIMDPGSDALDVLQGNLIKIRLGIIGVVNRSQQDILQKKPIAIAIEDEAKFLLKRYPTIADRNGQPYLAKRLSELLMRHIKKCLPDLRTRISSLISQYQIQLNSYGDIITDKAKTIIEIITKFSLSYCDTIRGGNCQKVATELCGGARIQYIFHDSFAQALMAINPLEGLDSKAILTVAKNTAGYRADINMPEVFEHLVTSEIKRLEEPSLRCVELVHEEMGRFVRYCGEEVQLKLLRFPRLREKIEEILTKLLNERLPVTREAVEFLVAYESVIIDTEHPRLGSIGHDPLLTNGSSSLIDDSSLKRERELRECDAIARKIDAYFNLIREGIKLSVPKIIVHCMVNHIKLNLQSALIEEIYKNEFFDELLSESDDIVRRRRETSEQLNALKKANEIISSLHYQKS